MSDGIMRTRKQIYTDISVLAALSEQELSETISSGQRRIENSIGWAISSFTFSGILSRVHRATYQITDVGLRCAEKWRNQPEITEKELNGLPLWDEYQKSIQERKGISKKTLALSQHHLINVSQENELNVSDYQKQAIQAIKEIEDIVAVELLSRLRNESPQFFEQAVLKLLLAMDYGGKESLFEHVGKSHDGGIDGVIKQDPLGIQNIYIQAKRYADGNTIGSKEIQSFVGALQGNGVERGVFITTSSFTKAAKEYAAKLLGKVVLIDGQYLVTLMIRYGVGVQAKRNLSIIEIDEDFFE